MGYPRKKSNSLKNILSNSTWNNPSNSQKIGWLKLLEFYLKPNEKPLKFTYYFLLPLFRHPFHARLWTPKSQLKSTPSRGCLLRKYLAHNSANTWLVIFVEYIC